MKSAMFHTLQCRKEEEYLKWGGHLPVWNYFMIVYKHPFMVSSHRYSIPRSYLQIQPAFVFDLQVTFVICLSRVKLVCPLFTSSLIFTPDYCEEMTNLVTVTALFFQRRLILNYIYGCNNDMWSLWTILFFSVKELPELPNFKHLGNKAKAKQNKTNNSNVMQNRMWNL